VFTFSGGFIPWENMKEDTKEKIIRKSLEIIGKEGVDAITMRRIATESDVNIASMNYHFGNKENLIREIILHFRDNMGQSFKFLEEENLSSRERVRGFITAYTQIMVEYRGLMRSFFFQIIGQKFQYPEVIEMIRKGLGLFQAELEKTRNGENPPEWSTMSAIALMGSVAYPILMGEQLEKIFGLNYQDPEIRKGYLDILVKRYCTETPAGKHKSNRKKQGV